MNRWKRQSSVILKKRKDSRDYIFVHAKKKQQQLKENVDNTFPWINYTQFNGHLCFVNFVKSEKKNYFVEKIKKIKEKKNLVRSVRKEPKYLKGI